MPANHSKALVLKSRNNQVALLICLAAFIFYIWQVFFTDAGYGDGDSITHYLIAHNAFKHPILFLHHWGKPFFTLFAAPLAYFGFNGMQSFNVLCAVVSGWLSYNIAEKLNIPFAPVAAAFCLAAPVYYINIPSGLTEIFFGLVLISATYFAVINKNITAAIIISFLPFCRSEGFLILPLFVLYFLYTKQYKALPFIVSGTLVYSIIGYFAYDDFGWIFHQNPYKTGDIYGHGELLYFVKGIKTITGIPLSIAFVIGLVYCLYLTYIQLRKNALNQKQAAELLLLFGSFCIYFLAHTIFWWKGLFASLGMTRVIAGVVPVFAVCALRGLSFFTHYIGRFSHWASFILVVIFTFIVIRTPIEIFGREEHLEPRLITIKQACDWLKAQNVKPENLYYTHPFVVINMDIDPYANTDSHELMYIRKDSFAQAIPTGNIVMWDSQFGPNESNTPLELLTDTTYFSPLKTFAPKEDIIVLGGRKFEARIFKRK